MARTYRRNTKKSQKATKVFYKNLYLAYVTDGWFPFVNLKNDFRFFTDNQKTVSKRWKPIEKTMERIFRHEGKVVLSRVQNVEDAQDVVFKKKPKFQFKKEVWIYWD